MMSQSAQTLRIQKTFEQFASATLEIDRDYGQPVSAARLIGINALALAAVVEPKTLGRQMSHTERQWLSKLSASLAGAAFSLSAGETIHTGSSLFGFNLLH
jgi:hypothetical protein